MLQILQNLNNGETILANVPAPAPMGGTVLVATSRTIVSIGTERMLVEFGKGGLLAKARQQPDKVKQVLAKIKTDGLFQTIDAVRSKLDQPLPLGYCNAGMVIDSSVAGLEPGDRVVSNGAHAEIVRVPRNLCARIPDNVDDESAAFTVLAAIGLQGIRLANPTLGETVVVFGLGLIGLLCVQMLRANGCRVLGIDPDPARCELAASFGAETVNVSLASPVDAAMHFSHGRGVDAVLVTASTSSDELMHQAAEMSRKRGRIVLVGVVGLNLRRDDFFKKEITFQVSASYGPGRYDPVYEEQGQDYPLGFVRWTEQRNFEAVLDLMSNGAIDVKPLITHRKKIHDAVQAYGLLDDRKALGIVLEYDSGSSSAKQRTVTLPRTERTVVAQPQAAASASFIGAGNYGSRVLIPAFAKAGARLGTLATTNGMSGMHHGSKAGFEKATTDLNEVWNDKATDIVVIATRHDAHAQQVIQALASGKHVFVEKPLALTLDELKRINEQYLSLQSAGAERLLMVGFNRRFAPHVVKMKALLRSQNAPKSIIMTVNAGAIPAEHWTQDPAIGGGRIIGEGCHFIDMMRHLIGHPVTGHRADIIGPTFGGVREDKASITLHFADGSMGTIHYFANGGKTFPKERIEVFCNDGVLQLDNYRVLRGYAWKGFSAMKLWKQDKGQTACVQAFVDAIRQGGASPIPYEELMESSRVSIEIAESLRQ